MFNVYCNSTEIFSFNLVSVHNELERFDSEQMLLSDRNSGSVSVIQTSSD